MKTARRSFDLKIQIRLALSALGMPVDAYPLNRMTIAQLEGLASSLHKEYDLRLARDIYARSLVRTDLDEAGLEFLARSWRLYNKMMLDLRFDRNREMDTLFPAPLAN